MKLHLPKSLRTALLACLAALAPVAVTLATGAISSGLVAFSISSAYAVDETGDLTSNTNWNASTDHSADTTTVSGATLKVGNGNGNGAGSVAANGTVNLGNLTLTGSSTMNLWAWTTTDKDVSTDGKVNIAGELTLNNSNIWMEDGSYYFSAPINVVGSSVITSKWAKGIVIGTIKGDDAAASLTLRSQGTDPTGALFTLGDGTEGESSFNGTLILDNAAAAEAKTTTLALNDSVALKDAALQLNNFTNVIIMLDRVLVEALYGSGDVAHSCNNATGHASPVVQITGNATESQLFSGTVASNVTWQIGNGSDPASSRFSGATLNGTLDIKAGSTAYLTGNNTIAVLNNSGVLSFNDGSSLTLESMANDFYDGKTYTVGNLALTSGGAVSNWAPYFGYTDGTEMTYQNGQLTVTVDGSAYYWNGTADSYSWSAANLLKGGNAATIAAGGRLYLTAEAAYKTVNMDSTVALAGIILQSDGYTLNVTANNTIPTNFAVQDSSYTLTKTGAATLTMSSSQIGKLAGITVNEGDLLVSDRSAVGKPITVNEGGTVVFAGNTASSVNTTVNGNGRVEVAFVTSGGHGRNVQLGSDFSGTLALTGLFKLNECQIGSSASYEFSSGEAWTNDNHTVANNINVVGATADDFRFRANTGNTLTLTGKVTGNYSVGHSDNRGTIILANINSGAGTVDLDYGTLQLGNDSSTGTISGVAFDDMVINTADGTNLTIKIKANDSNTAEDAYQLGSTLNISGTVNMTIADGSYHFAEKISLSEGAKLSINNGWDKNQFFSAIDAANATIVMAAANQANWNTNQRLFLLNSDGVFNLQGSKIELKSAAKSEYVHGLAVQKAGALSGAEVSFSSDASDQGSVLLFTNADYRESTAVTAATRVDGSVAGLSGTKGKVYAAGLTINTAAEKSYTYGGELHVTSLTKSGAGAQSLTQGLSLTGALNVQAGTLTLAGEVGVASITNTGIIDITSVETLTIGDLAVRDGRTYDIGTLTGYESKDWNALLGVSQDYQVDYSGGNLLFSVDDDIPAIWVGGTGAVWDGTDSAGNTMQSWVKDGADFVPGSLSSLILGNADTLADAGYTDADEVSREIIVDSDVAVKSLTVEDAYSLSVADGESHSFDAGTIVLDGGSLSKRGAGTLSMSSEDAVAAQMNIVEGTLSLSDTLRNTVNAGSALEGAVNTGAWRESGLYADLSALTSTAEGTLQLRLAGDLATGNDSTRLKLGAGFLGKIEVTGGLLGHSSELGGAQQVVLNGGGIVFNNDANDSNNDNTVFGTAVHVIGDSALRVWEAYDANTPAILSEISGVAGATLYKYDRGVIRVNEFSEYAGNVNVQGGKLVIADATDSANIGTLTLAGGTGLTLDNNATLTATTTATNGAVTVGATEGATFNMGAVSIAADATLKLEGAGRHTLSTLAMGNNATLELAANTSASITTAKAGTPTGTNGYPGARSGVRELSGTDFTIKVGTGAELTDAGAWELSNASDMTVSGGGVYHVAGVGLSMRAANSTSLTIDTDTTLHITGTDTTGSKFGDSFSLGHWDPDNTVTVRGTLELECGLSTSKNAANEGNSYKGYTAINVESGGKLAFNNGLHASVSRRGAYTTEGIVPDYVKENFHHVAVNIADGGVLEISGTNNAGAEDVYVTLQNNAIVMGGGANSNKTAVFGGTVRLGSGFYAGAVEGTTLTLNVSPDGGWVHVLGSESTVYTAGGTVEFGQESIRLNALNVDAGGTARINHSAELYINEWGSINIAGTLIFDAADTITLNKAINNTGTVEVLNATDTRFVLSDALLQEVVGVSKTWTLVDNNNSGSITHWDELRLENFLLDGSTLQQGDWDGVRITDGKVMLYMLSRYWDATGAESVWNTGVDANWREFVDSTETVTFEANSRVTFTDTDENGDALDKSVTVADAGVQAKNVVIAGTGYEFSGGKVAVTHSMSIQESAKFASTLVIGSTSTPLSVDVWEGKTLTVGTLETSSSVSYGNTIYNNGAFLKTGEGTLLITDAINGTITEASISGGKLALGVAGAGEIAEQSVDLMVGANTISSAGGSLENVVLQTSGTVTDYTGATAQALNVIKSADGVNYAALTDVQLRAGAASSYATLQKVAFAGTSALSGYITFEESKQQRQMAVATGGTLTVSNLTFDLNGLSAGTKVLIENDAVEGAADGFKGTLQGWDAQNVKLLYSGIAVNNAAVDMGTAGVVTLNTAETNTAANMYWDGLVAGAAEGDDPVASSAWDKSSANWSGTAGTNGTLAFLALSNTYFGATPAGGSKVVNATLDMVMSNMFVTEGGYSFTGSRLATLGNMSITPASGEVSFANELVVQGNVNLSAAQNGSVTLGGALQAGGTITATGEGTLSFNSTVQSGGDITLTGNGVVTLAGNVSTAGNFSIGTEGAAVTDKADATTLYTIAGALTAKDILINIDASEQTAAADTGDHLVVSGNVSAKGDAATPAADGTITLLGSAAKKFTGYVTADTLRVNAAHDALNNVITFTNVVDVNTLEIAEDTYVRIAHAGSDMDTVLLGGTLYMDSTSTTYDNGYDVYSTSDSAELVFGTISSNTINLISGLTPAEAADDVADAGQYNSISVNANTRFLTVNALAALKDLTLYNGPMTVNAGEGAIHGNLVVRDAAGLVLTQNANNIMAEGSGSITVDHANMNLNSTTQTLRSGNDLYLVGGAITGNANGVGLNFVGTSSINYTGNNTVSANMTVADGKTLTLKAGYAASQSQSTVALSSDDTLMLSGALSGTGALNLTGDGVVTINKANSAYTGTVTVGGGSSLKLTHVDALSEAAISLAGDGTLVLNAGAPVNVAGLTIADGTSLSLIGLAPTDAADLDAAGLINADTNGINWTKNNDSLTLNILLDQEVENMMTYNLFTDKQALATSGVTLKVYHNGQLLDASQYNVGYDADKKLVYIRTMIGNIWNGGSKLDGETNTADGIWSVTNNDKNWSGKDYDENSAYNDAIFADLTGEGAQHAVVTIQGKVNPGEIYFEADSTQYELIATQDGALLAAGNVIHKAGKAGVTLNLAGNGTAANALGGMDLQTGTTKLAANLAVKGEVSVAAGATLQTDANRLLVVVGDAEAYTAQGTYSGLTLDATGIAGVSGAPGTVTNGIISGAAELNNLNLTGTGTLTDVAIGSGVNVATGAGYTLNGHITFLDTLQNAGTVTLDAAATVEIGSLGYTFGVAATDTEGAQYGVNAGGSYYMYRLVQGGTINGMEDLTVDDVYINGVKLGGSNSGLANGMAAVFTNNNGELTLSIGTVTSGENEELKVDGTVGMPSWDERWGKSEAEPALSRRYAGTDAAATISLAEGKDTDADFYQYSSVVNADNAAKVNGGKAVVVTLSSAARGTRVVGGSSSASKDMEMWVYDRSAVQTVVGGQFQESGKGYYKQSADTHILVNTEQSKTLIVGGSWNVDQNADSYVTVQNGTIGTVVGGTYGANQEHNSTYVYLDGGAVTNVYAGGYDWEKNADYYGDILNTNLVITGGTHTNVYGGSYYGKVHSNVKVTVDGTATITNLVGGGVTGAVAGNITLNLLSGSAGTVHAAGAKDTSVENAGNASVTGDVGVYLSRDFDVSAGLFGGKQNNSGVTVSGTSTLYLTDAGEYVFAKWQGDAAGTHDGFNQTLVEGSAVTIAGFDVVSLAQGAVLTVDTNHFDRNITNGTLVITGNGIVQMGGKAGARRDIRLENGATFKLLSSYTADNYSANGNKYAGYSKLYVTDGTTFDISGYPRENAANDGGGCIAYHVYLSGDGVDGMGALYKGATDKNNSTNPSGKAALGYIELTGNASATAEHNIDMIGPNNATTYLDLNGYTYTKRGEGAYVLRNTQINGGTYYAHEGTVQPEKTTTGADADLVLSDAATLKLNDNCNFTMRSLTGSGDTELGAFKLTLAPVSGGKYYAEFMNEANSYDNLMSGTGFAYGVYSGVITGSGSLYIGNKTSMSDRTGVQYLSGTDSTYSGGTHVEAGRLYLLSSTQGSISKGSSSVTSGPIGTGALYWDSSTAEVYLGHGVTVYNSGGTNAAGSDLILGVEGAPDGDLLKNYPGVNGTVVKDGVTYYEVDTHNLQSISCDGVYADGTAYVAGTEIDRNKMLLVTEAAWNSESSTVKGFTDTGYNEATYSGVLSGAAALVKVGAGTLVIDQANAYTGGTRIQAGTLKLKGWAQIGAAADGTIDVTQTAGSTLMLAYDGTYGDELTSISNNMVLTGTGDARWEGSDETGGGTAALISDVGSGVTFTLSGDISGDGNLLHSGEGTLVLSGDSSYTGGMHATRGVVEVQSATGLGAGVVTVDSASDLHVTVEDGTTASRLATTIKAPGSSVKGDVVINGTETTERILNIAVPTNKDKSQGYTAPTTTVGDNGTLLLNGDGINAETALLTGSGTLAVSDATGNGASANVGQMTDYTGDLHVEGNNASIVVENGNYSGGSISVSGNGANVSTKGDVTIVSGESLSLTSKGNAGETDTSAAVRTTGAVNVTNGATLSVAAAETRYEYNLQNLQASASLNTGSDLESGAENQAYTAMGTSAEEVYNGFFNTSVAMNQKAAGSVDAEDGLTLSGGASYETSMANTSLMGGTLTLDTTTTSLLNFDTTLDAGVAAIDGSGRTTQLVLFSDVGGVNFVLDNRVAGANSGIYYTRADRYISGCGYVDEETWLVYDSGAGVVYLDGIIPEPTTATLSLLALAALAARRRRK